MSFGLTATTSSSLLRVRRSNPDSVRLMTWRNNVAAQLRRWLAICLVWPHHRRNDGQDRGLSRHRPFLCRLDLRCGLEVVRILEANLEKLVAS